MNGQEKRVLEALGYIVEGNQANKGVEATKPFFVKVRVVPESLEFSSESGTTVRLRVLADPRCQLVGNQFYETEFENELTLPLDQVVIVEDHS